MTSSVRLCLGLVVASAALAFVGCGDDDDAISPGAGGNTAQGGAEAHGGANGHGGATEHGGAPHGGGDLTCTVLGKLCHEADTGSGVGHECHELGHLGNADGCSEGFDSCIAFCVSDDGAGGAGSGGAAAVPTVDARCAALGELCHPVDDADGPLHECHELGHVGNAATCAAAFDDCATRCLAAREELESVGSGGAGTGGASSGAAAGAAATGGAGGAL